MMYLKYSQYWSMKCGKDTYCMSNGKTYTHILAMADVYSEEDLVKMRECGTNRDIYIPLTKELLDKSSSQLRELGKRIDKKLNALRKATTRINQKYGIVPKSSRMLADGI